MIYEYLRNISTNDSVLDLSDLIHEGDAQGRKTGKSVHNEAQSFGEQLKTIFALYNEDTVQKNEPETPKGQDVPGPKDEGSKVR